MKTKTKMTTQSYDNISGTTKQETVESGGKILVYMYIKWYIPVVLVVFDIFLIISNKINNK